jgi:UDP-N-acetyl-D-galactosamine dehydrogenase
VYDPWIDQEEAQHEYGLTPITQLHEGQYDAIVLAVAHRQFSEMGITKIRALGKPVSVLFDVKYLFAADQVDGRL